MTDPTPQRLDVLVADSIAASREALAALVCACGHDVRCAEDAGAALARIAERPPHVVLLDLKLPGAEGFALIGRIRAEVGNDALCVIAVSALQGEPLFEEAVRHGADDCLVHPVSPALLAARLRMHARLLALRSSTRRASGAVVPQDASERTRIERMRSEFLATVSHELRTPLTTVLGAVSLLSAGAGGALTPPGQRLAAAAQRNGRRLHRLIDDILDVTKAEADRLVVHPRQFALRPVLDEALAVSADAAQAARVTLASPCKGVPLPPVHGDPDRIVQILAHLLSNAIKHAPTGSAIELAAQVQPDHVSLSVTDTGPGVPPAHRPHLFEKFSRADGSDTRDTGGAGLGLYLSQLLARRMGTCIELDDGHAEGTRFRFRLAVAAEAPA